jgi:hypothetical protein
MSPYQKGNSSGVDSLDIRAASTNATSPAASLMGTSAEMERYMEPAPLIRNIASYSPVAIAETSLNWKPFNHHRPRA